MRESAFHDSLTDCTLNTTGLDHLIAELNLEETEVRELLRSYVESQLRRQILWLRPSDIRVYFDPDIHLRLAHWLASHSQ